MQEQLEKRGVKCLKKKNHQPRINHPVKLFFRSKGEILSQTMENWGNLCQLIFSVWNVKKSSSGIRKIIWVRDMDLIKKERASEK